MCLFFSHFSYIFSPSSFCLDSLQVMMYKNFKEKMKYFQSSSSSSSAMKLKPIFELEHYLGIESGFVHDRESNTMAIICIEQTILLAFETREILLQWQTKLQEHFCKGKLYFFSLTPLSFHHKLELFFFLFFFCLCFCLVPF